MSWTTGARALAAACMFVCINSLAQTSQTQLVNAVHTVAAATQAVPLEYPLPALPAGTYQVTLTDLGAQLPTSAPLASAELAITDGNAIVGTPSHNDVRKHEFEHDVHGVRGRGNTGRM